VNAICPDDQPGLYLGLRPAAFAQHHPARATVPQSYCLDFDPLAHLGPRASGVIHERRVERLSWGGKHLTVTGRAGRTVVEREGAAPRADEEHRAEASRPCLFYGLERSHAGEHTLGFGAGVLAASFWTRECSAVNSEHAEPLRREQSGGGRARRPASYHHGIVQPGHISPLLCPFVPSTLTRQNGCL
jgi:hypothetical protein